MSEYPDRISVRARREQWVYPVSADIVFLVKGQSSISTSQAMKKAKEVETLIAELERADVKGLSTYIDSANYSSSKGILSGSSQAVFKVVVVEVETDKVPLCMGVGANQKGVSLEAVNWNYGELHKERLSLLQQVASDCREYADAIAHALGIKRGLIYSSSLDWQEPGDFEPYASKGLMLLESSLAEGPSEQGFTFPIQKRSILSVSMRAEFHCAET